MNDIRTMRIDKITFDDVLAFCKEQIPEDVRLDYKRDVPQDLAKVIASFANTQGGTLVLGVGADREHKHRPEPSPAGAELGPDIRRTIAELCATQIWPPVSPEVSDFIRQSDSAARGRLRNTTRIRPMRANSPSSAAIRSLAVPSERGMQTLRPAYFDANPAQLPRAIDVLLDTSRDFDRTYGHLMDGNLTQLVWQQLMDQGMVLAK